MFKKNEKHTHTYMQAQCVEHTNVTAHHNAKSVKRLKI